MKNENLKYLLFSILLVVFSCDDGGDILPVYGCTDTDACNYSSEDGANTDDATCLYNDCNDECGGTAIEDCDGVCDGLALEDNCGMCDLDPENDCDADCNGDFGGTAVEDDCGECNGNNANMDCDGDCNGTIEDCLGECGGSAVVDECGECDGDDSSCVPYSDIQNIFNSSCTNCHGPSGGLSLASYTSLMNGGNSGAVIIPGDHASSLLWIKVNTDDMPNNCSSNCLSQGNKDLIANWIDQGANNP
jgi:hypothetical protein